MAGDLRDCGETHKFEPQDLWVRLCLWTPTPNAAHAQAGRSLGLQPLTAAAQKRSSSMRADVLVHSKHRCTALCCLLRACARRLL